MSSTITTQSKNFEKLITSIGETRSKSEEDRIILHEIETLKHRITKPNISKQKMKEYIIRLLYIEMLGHDASFGYIHAVKMTHDDSILLKRTGYLAVMLFLNEDSDLIMLIVNNIMKDLKSDNYLVVCVALNVVCKLINEETIPVVVQQVVELLGHSKDAVRKKAVMALHRFYQRSPSSVAHYVSNFRKKLCDNDPGVMGATLCPLFDLITIDANSHKDLVGSFVSILKQVAERRLPKTYDYHQTPAPFIQIKLLKILALLGNGDKQSSEQMYTIIGDVLRKCDTTSNIGNAVLYECICCVASIHPNPKLFKAAADAIAKLLKSNIHNYKYMGIDALRRLIRISPEVAEQHQLSVIDCLEDPDDTLKRKTFELLYKMTKSSNVEVIVDRMIHYMISINDNHYKTEIASRCVELAEQFAPSNHWFIQTMNKVFQHAGDIVNPKVAHNLMRLIAEGFGEDDDAADSQLRSSAVESYLRIMGEPKLPSTFLQVICWVLGEYGTADGKNSGSYISGKLCDVAEAHPSDDIVKAYAVSAIMKICSYEKAAGRKMDMLPECQSLIESLSASHSTDLQQRAYELQAFIGLDGNAMQNIMPFDATCEDIEIDTSLSFLNGYVQKSLEEGAKAYIPGHERNGSNLKNHDATHSLKFEAYEVPKPVIPRFPPKVFSSTQLVNIADLSYQKEVHRSPSVGSLEMGSNELKLRLDGVQKKWGRPNFSNSESDRTTGYGITKAKSVDLSRMHSEDISEEKQKLAASLFGATSSRSEKKQPVGQTKGSKAPRHAGHQTSQVIHAPPDLLDLGAPTSSPSGSSSTIDPFKQLEGLIDPTQGASTSGKTQNEHGSSLTHGSVNTSNLPAPTKGPNLKDALGKDALVRQMGVTPTNQNPNLFKDLLG